MSMSNIKHVIHLMLENRSLDNLLGWLYPTKYDQPKHVYPAPKPGGMNYNGLSLGNFSQVLNPVGSSYPKKTYPIIKGVQANNFPCATPFLDPGETYKNVNYQLFEQYDTPPYGKKVTNGGFLQDYYNEHPNYFKDKDPATSGVLEMMNTYTPAQLPVINTLANRFAVSDEWYCSIPSQTNCNRAFSLCGTSLGMVDNKFTGTSLEPQQFNTRTIWNVLNESGLGSPKDWRIYYSASWPPWEPWQWGFTYRMLPGLRQIVDTKTQMLKIDKFFEDLDNHDLPSFSYLEPKYALDVIWAAGWPGDDYHPPSHVIDGEDLLRKIYTALTKPQNKSVWDKTLFIITFDEHGGTYDHVKPKWGAVPPTPGMVGEYGFKFDRHGVRVPTILVSPYIKDSTVFRSRENQYPFEHSSFLATLLNWFNIPKTRWRLYDRVYRATSFAPVLSDTARSDVPALPGNWCDQYADSDYPYMLTSAYHMAGFVTVHYNLSNQKAPEIYKDILENCKTQGDLTRYFAEFEGRKDKF